MTPEEEIERAEEARRILEEPMFKDAVSQVEEALLQGLRRAAIVDDKMREKLAVRYAVLHDLIGCLRTTMETGKLAVKQLEQDQQRASMKERFKAYVGF